MSRKLRIALFVHSLRSDWNNGNAHFLRGLVRALGAGVKEKPYTAAEAHGHHVTVFEPTSNWSADNLAEEPQGSASLDEFARTYAEFDIRLYRLDKRALRHELDSVDVIVVHEWNEPALIEVILSLRDELHFKALFHDTHHRASSSPSQLRLLQVERFDGVIAFGEALRAIYVRDFNMERVWTLHEAADTSIFVPRQAAIEQDVVWIGNWGDDERSAEIREFLVSPAASLRHRRVLIYGVRYPPEALQVLASAGITYGGYLPNLSALAIYAASRLTVHIPRQHYAGAMAGIPTIRVFEALASGIPLISAPWDDVERLFEPGDFLFVKSQDEMLEAMEFLLNEPRAAAEQAARGLRTVLARHTCAHRALELSRICEEVLA